MQLSPTRAIGRGWEMGSLLPLVGGRSGALVSFPVCPRAIVSPVVGSSPAQEVVFW